MDIEEVAQLSPEKIFQVQLIHFWDYKILSKRRWQLELICLANIGTVFIKILHWFYQIFIETDSNL